LAVSAAPHPPREGSPHTVAVVLATTRAAGLACAEGSLLDRLTGQLRALPVRALHVVTRTSDPVVLTPHAGVAEAETAAATGVRAPRDVSASAGLAEDLRGVAAVARASSGPVAVLPGDLVAHTEALALLLEHPSYGTAALTGPREGAGPLRPPVRVERGRVAAAGNVFHEVTAANGTFGGVLQVGEADLAGLAEVADELAGLAETGRLGLVTDAEAGELLLTGLVRSGVPVRAAMLGRLRADRVTSQAAADAAIRRLGEVDESRARLDAAIKDDDGFFTTYAVSSWSRYLVPIAARLALTPNSVTAISAGLAAIAATWFSAGDRVGLAVGAATFYLAFVFDCVDGQLARYTRRFSPLGAWLDAIFDRGKEWLVYVGLAAGYAGDVWALAVAAMLVQGLRHMVDFSFAGAAADAARIGAAWTRPARSLSLPYDVRATAPASYRAGVGAGVGAGTVELSRLFETATVTRWMKRIVVLPIGERTALICVTAALFDARVTFVALLGWGGAATLYTLAGRVGRSLR
jgi:phosphatidylglycerophosphate synthase